ncbi:DegT/DnrJ/EryC1/StrS family aminotransferase [Pseudaestuariivita sp.]|uniref:DegT/DnrJ/EryC1/StrS family aminotransferase n=1 Tax=Pseudaestuariivita sp. TaxID=2211669 RepID=UPI00405A1159
MAPRFTKPFIRQEPIPEAGIAAAVEVMRSGALHRYGWPEGESPAEALERRFAAWQGAAYCLAVASGGQAMRIALTALGVGAGDKVLTNAWTLAPVPGAIASVGAEPVLVETTEDMVIDLDDLAAKADASGARTLLLSHMRGHLADMAALVRWADGAGVTVVEDCAHTMGAEWAGAKSGNFGKIACFSLQTYKHLNAGEGGLLTTDDPVIAARATVLSGSYMLWARHGAGPPVEAFEAAQLDMPNGSARMDNLRAALVLPQLDTLDANLARWDRLAELVRTALAGAPDVALPAPAVEARRIGSSIQWRIPALDAAGCTRFVEACAARGVEVKWFGAAAPKGFTSAHTSWRYVAPQALPRTDAVLATLFDMRLPLTFTEDDARLLGEILADVAAETVRVPA